MVTISERFDSRLAGLSVAERLRRWPTRESHESNGPTVPATFPASADGRRGGVKHRGRAPPIDSGNTWASGLGRVST